MSEHNSPFPNWHGTTIVAVRQNNKTVIGLGVKNSTSDLFINNCDEFLYYDDLVRPEPPKARRRTAASAAPAAPKAGEGSAKVEGLDKLLDLVMETLEALSEERRGNEPVYGSMIKQTIKRRHPGFNEKAHGFRSFNDLLLEAQQRNLLRLTADAKSGGDTVVAAE